ncbi:MAG: hypothetical protein WD876_03565 [Candidatus Pacearchaeota archaeon]
MEKRFCPKCKSENVKVNITPSLAMGIPQNWMCNDCGYSNILFPTKTKIKQIKR